MEKSVCEIPVQENKPAQKLAARRYDSQNTIVDVDGIRFGDKELVIIAGPCAVESQEQLFTTAKQVAGSGANILRGGAFKPRTSPYSFRGLEEEGLELLAKARTLTGLPVITEVMDTRYVKTVSQYADILQIGSRNMNNYPLLKEAGLSKMPVLLKRGMNATIDELLWAAEYILSHGNEKVILCERGIRTYETAYRNTLDLNAVPMLRHLTHLPVIVDPSHGTGIRWMVSDMAKAAIAAGADGLMMEVHHDPEAALCDGSQSLFPEDFEKLMQDLQLLAPAVGRKMHAPHTALV